MRTEIDLRTYDFAEPFCGSIVKNQFVWRRYFIEKANSLGLKGLSLLLYKLSLPISAFWETPCSKNN